MSFPFVLVEWQEEKEEKRDAARFAHNITLTTSCVPFFFPVAAESAEVAAPKGQANAQEGPFPVPEMTQKRTDVKPFEYLDVGRKIPNYKPSRVWGVQGEPLAVAAQLLNALAFAAFSKISRPGQSAKALRPLF